MQTLDDNVANKATLKLLKRYFDKSFMKSELDSSIMIKIHIVKNIPNLAIFGR
jgi:hypothetical protein